MACIHQCSPGRRFVSRGARILWISLLCMLAGCVSYQSKPLGGSIPLSEEWSRRSPTSPEIRSVAVEMATSDSLNVYDPSDGLSRHEAAIVALFYNPQLREARLRARIPILGAVHAGAWDDPEIGADAMRILDHVQSPWILGASLGFTIPISGRLSAEKSKAAAEGRAALHEVYQREQEVVQELNEAWIAWSASHRQHEAARAFLEDIEKVSGIVERMMKAGELTQAEGNVFLLSRARRRIESAALEAETREREMRLYELMGLSPEARLDLRPSLAPDSPPGTLAISPTLLEERNPVLQLRRAQYEASEETLHLEIRKQYPDLTLSPSYARDSGQDQLGIGLRFPLPIFNGNRRAIAEAQAARDASRASYRAELETLNAALIRTRHRLEAAQSRRDALLETVIPLADRQNAEARRLAELGEVPVLLLKDALEAGYETQTQWIEAQAEVLRARNALEALAPLPRFNSPANAVSSIESNKESLP